MMLTIVGGRLCRGSLPMAALENLTIWSNKPSALWPADRVVHRFTSRQWLRCVPWTNRS